MENVSALDDHPLVQRWLTELRDERTSPEDFRKYLRLVTSPLLLKALADFRVFSVKVATPLGWAIGHNFGEHIAVAAILRAALGMVDTIQQVVPGASVFHIDMHRNERTLEPVWVRDNLPEDCSPWRWMIPDPMLATGGSAILTISTLKERGAKNIQFVGVVAAPEGVAALRKVHPDVPIVVAVIDEYLTDGSDGRPKGYIVPGLGDAGDRQFGTAFHGGQTPKPAMRSG